MSPDTLEAQRAAADRRLTKARLELNEANENLDRCEREHRIASELVDHWSRITANPQGNEP